MNNDLDAMLKSISEKKDDKTKIYIITNSVFIKGKYFSHDSASITLSSFSCNGGEENKIGTIKITKTSITAWGSTLPV